MIIIRNIRIPLGQTENDAILKAKQLLRFCSDKILLTYLYKVSIDARYDTPFFIYSIAVTLSTDEKAVVNKLANKDIIYKETNIIQPIFNFKTKIKNPVVVGFGPSGMFCALELARLGYNPIVLERGEEIAKRKITVNNFATSAGLNTSSNIQFGEGGAGTFSDGKLTTRINDKYCDYVLSLLHKFGADKDILTNAKPHIGSDVLQKIVVNIRNEIIKLGGKILFNTTLESIKTTNKSLTTLVTTSGEIDTDFVVLAIGHSARDTYKMLNKNGIEMASKPFSVGFRIEHKQSFINELFYKKYADDKRLPPMSYQLSFTKGERGVYSFCMCPGGSVVAAASEENMVVTNGMSNKNRDNENANSAIVASVSTADYGNDLFGGMEFQKQLEAKAFSLGGGNYYAPVQTAKDFINNQKTTKLGNVAPSYSVGTTMSNLSDVFPSVITTSLVKGLRVFEGAHKGFSGVNAVLTGVETRTSAPVRILRDENFETNIKGIYPIGEGSGYAGGIMSSIIDAIKFLETIK